jgi:hypothetical protein
MTNVQSSGIEAGQRRLNGPQTTGREYHTLSQPTHGTAHDDDVAVPMRDGVMLLADVHRPAEPGRYPVLVAASPYPRQIQNLGAPAGFIEAGASDFFAPRGCVHGRFICKPANSAKTQIDRAGGELKGFEMRAITQDHDPVEGQARFRAIPINEHIDGVTISPLCVR